MFGLVCCETLSEARRLFAASLHRRFWAAQMIWVFYFFAKDMGLSGPPKQRPSPKPFDLSQEVRRAWLRKKGSCQTSLLTKVWRSGEQS